MSGTFRSARKFDPILHTAQILTLQSLHYASASFFMVVVAEVTNAPFGLFLILGFDQFELGTARGWAFLVAAIVTAGLEGYFLRVVVERSRLCLDFSCTLYAIHTILSLLYNAELPPFLWILETVLFATIMHQVGRFLCMRSEMKPIYIGAAAREERIEMQNRGDTRLEITAA